MTGKDRGVQGAGSVSRAFRQSQFVASVVRRLSAEENPLLIEGVALPATLLLASALEADRPVVFLVGSQDAGERAADAFAVLRSRTSAEDNSEWYFVGHSSAFLEEGSEVAASDAERLKALDCLASGRECFIVATVAGLLQRTFSPDDARGAVLEIAAEGRMDLPAVLHHLVRVGYHRVEMVQQPGEFAARGGILDVYPVAVRAPLRIDLFGDEVESLRWFNPVSQRSTGSLRTVRILPAREPVRDTRATFLDYLPGNALLVVDDASLLRRKWDEFEGEVRDQLSAMAAGLADGEEIERPEEENFPFWPLPDAVERLKTFQSVFLTSISKNVPWGKPRAVLSLTCDPAPRIEGDMDLLVQKIREWRADGVRTWLVSHQWPRLAEILRKAGIDPSVENGAGSSLHVDEAQAREDHSPPLPPGRPDSDDIAIVSGSLSEGFHIPSAQIMVLSDAEIFGGVKIRRSRRTSRETSPLASYLELKPGDMVVHIDHGIGVFRGLKTMDVEGTSRDYLHLEYAQGDKLFVPTDQMDRVQRYLGSEDRPPVVHRLGGTDWARTKRRVRQAVEDMAKELIELYAARATREGHAFGSDTPWQQEMESAFVYEETGDQLKAIQDAKDDLESPKPMDRLICGDVGYGKTEVAVRIAFKVVMDGKQVAVLVPTTVLAQQHLNTFIERLNGFPVRIEMLSRFRSQREQQTTIEGMKQGAVDIVIGTHRLLSKDVGFKDLGLVIVDEEHRFGVAHKERLKQMRQMVDVITLTATPIPRTLQMSLSSIRDMSVINQAPEGRTSVRTYLREYSDSLVQQCILRELERNGQVYFLHNRVENMAHVIERLRNLVPRARIAMGHGQMPESDLEQVMLDFYAGAFDVLCCTTIIESGLDIPNVNTIIINDSDRLGLAQLYQLRGRVGRSNRQAYCYLLFKPDKELTELAQKRLRALREFSELGSGFRVALRDLEIRGAGNLLGTEQHGAMMSVGFDLYCQMIADAVRTLKNEPLPPPPLPPVELPLSAYIPGAYIAAESLRIDFYRRLNSVTSADELVGCQQEMQDRFGSLPLPVRNLIAILRLRLQCRRVGITSIGPDGEYVVIRLGPRLRLSPAAVASLHRKHPYAGFMGDRVLVKPAGKGLLGPVLEIANSLQGIWERRQAAGIVRHAN